jgi:hypothetical protein
MNARIARIGIVALWAVTMSWLLRYEAFPAFFTRTLAGYKGYFAGGQVFMDSWMKILMNGAHVGYSHTQIDVEESNPAEQYSLNNKTSLSIGMLGERQQITVVSEAKLDALYRLQKFLFALTARRYATTIEGRRDEGGIFVVTVRSESGVRSLKLEIPDDVILYSPMTAMAMSRLEPGKSLRLRTLDPASLTVGDLVVRALRKEPITGPGGEVDATVLEVGFQGMEMLTWIDKDGVVLRQETPFGWSLEACGAEEAVALPEVAAGQAPDLLRQLSVPVRGVTREPRRCPRLTIRLKGLGHSITGLNNARQQATERPDGTVDIALTRTAGPAAASAEPPPAGLDAYLASSPFVQADDPAIIAQTQSIVGDTTNVWTKALAISHWVNGAIAKNPAVSLPSAKDVLARREGDCNEHTYLFTALARAAGIPTQIRVGLFYNQGAFYYHAWPAVYAGGWVELDPTLGFDEMGAGHIALVEGELGSQLKLVSSLGRLRASVVSESHD